MLLGTATPYRQVTSEGIGATSKPSADLSWRLDGRVALVTGSSAGLGRRFAEVLHAAGARVVGTGRRRELLDELSGSLGSGFEGLAGDITDPQHRELLIEHLSRIGRLDVMVNNAGTCDDGPIAQQSLDDLTRVVDVNLISVMDLCRLAAPLLFATPGSTVINVASMYGLVASRGPMAAYNATKGAIVNLTRHLAAQWGEYGVRVNALAPGYFPSEMTGDLADPDFQRSIWEHTLLKRIPGLHELDGPLLFLSSDAASYMTGQVLVVDGGWTAI